jgi:hypothetical protein
MTKSVLKTLMLVVVVTGISIAIVGWTKFATSLALMAAIGIFSAVVLATGVVLPVFIISLCRGQSVATARNRAGKAWKGCLDLIDQLLMQLNP